MEGAGRRRQEGGEPGGPRAPVTLLAARERSSQAERACAAPTVAVPAELARAGWPPVDCPSGPALADTPGLSVCAPLL